MQRGDGFLLRFLRLAGQFWRSEKKLAIRKRTLTLIALTLLQITIAVVITEWSSDLFNALQNQSMSNLWRQIWMIVLIFVANIAVTAYHFKVKRRLQIDWRTWLTDQLTSRWMHEGRHYLLTHIPGEHDNPDGRIAEDCRIATESAIDMGHSLFYSLLMLASFTKILWTLSGVIALDLGFVTFNLYGHLVWIAIVYALAASWLGWLIGQPLTHATDTRQTAEANFRFSLVTARENSQAIALIRAELCERQKFQHLFRNIRRAWRRQTLAWRSILMFSSGYSVLSMAFPILVSAPRYILGQITLGGLMQSAQSFQHMVSALSWPVDNLAKVAEWRASVERVLGLVQALDDLEREMTEQRDQWIRLEPSPGRELALEHLSIAEVYGEILASDINLTAVPGEHVWVTGNASTGAKLFRAIAGLRFWGSGSIKLPQDELFFMRPKPYLPKGTLRAAIAYPLCISRFHQTALEEALRLTGLEDLIGRLDQIEDWAKILPRETQQRLGAVRLLLNRPQWIFLQQAFDSLNPDEEERMLRMIFHELPQATLFTLTNLPSAKYLHSRQLIV